MSLWLSAADVSALVRASTVLLDPLGYESGDVWQREACAAVRAFVRADAASTTQPSENGTILGGEQEVVDVLRRAYPPPDWARRALTDQRRERQLVVADWTELFDKNRVLQSAFYNDVVRPNRLLAPISMMEEIVPDQIPAAISVYWFDERNPADRVAENKLKLQLLLPAFRAGVRAYHAIGSRRQDTIKIAEAAPVSVALCDEKGGLIHANNGLTQLLEADPHSKDLLKAIGLAASKAATPFADLGSVVQSGSVSFEIRTAASHYRLSAVMFDQGRTADHIASIVFVESLGPRSLSATELAKRFALTPREVQIAKCLEQGLASKTIAQVLGISPNTARRHVERVLAKLNVHSRAAVGATISRA